MAGTSTPNGQQQISIYPYQQLSSFYGNQILHGVLTPGVYSTSVSISTDASNVTFSINPGTSLVFLRRPYDDVLLKYNSIIGKITIVETAAEVTIAITSLQTTPYDTSQVLYLVADWTYDIDQPTVIYVDFQLKTESSIATIKSGNISSPYTHSLIVATILNHQAFVSSGDISDYKIAYDYEDQRGVFERGYVSNKNFNIDFDQNGRGLYVEAGTALSGDTIIDHQPYFNESVDYLVVTGGGASTGEKIAINGTDYALTGDVSTAIKIADLVRGLTVTNYSIGGTIGTNRFTITPNTTAYAPPTVGIASTNPLVGTTYTLYNPLPYPPRTRTISNPPARNIIRPATGSQYYTSDYVNNTQIDVIGLGTEEDYYQIDFLRIKKEENTGITNIYWESFLQPLGTLDTDGWTETNIKAYLSQYRFPLSGSGVTLLIAIRKREDIPVVDGNTNILWPYNADGTYNSRCILLKDSSIPTFGEESVHSRFKVPVWTTTDLGLT